METNKLPFVFIQQRWDFYVVLCTRYSTYARTADPLFVFVGPISGVTPALEGSDHRELDIIVATLHLIGEQNGFHQQDRILRAGQRSDKTSLIGYYADRSEREARGHIGSYTDHGRATAT